MMGVNRCINSLISALKANRAVLSPGSRNAPILNAISNSNLPISSIADERSAGFIALGMAKHLKAPVILNCTSGTAALNYYPAIAEAFYARVPLIVITADRPPEQIDAWDGQAIRQKKVFANHIRASFETPSVYTNETEFAKIALQVNKHWDEGIPGPIHINVPIREPFYEDMSSVENSVQTMEMNSSQHISLLKLQEHLNEDFLGRQILVFNGMESGEEVKLSIDCLAWQTIELSDVTSNISSEISSWDAFLFNQIESEFKGCENLRPDVLITTGTTTVSKGLKLFLKKFAPKVHYHISNYNEIGSMFGTKPIWVDSSNPDIWKGEEQLIGMAQWSSFKSEWMAKTDSFNQKYDALTWDEFTEFSAVEAVLEKLPENAILHLANSMSVRYASYLKGIIDTMNIEVRSNRGTSGIDGCTSTAVGEAICTKKTVYLITGDVAFLYDINGLW
ncbi:MAG: 2-succinyl-5-enolpyruvyl-6-hydroxy-3-cyclohexene-1-carboxylic-acid synthase, partial [Bacteroidia bacterium]|nr:2-succinyl-5-enolpyruvyl-6-hydroxy-3-cyclohexene-1-carboxylic-acid synthase [Bacteroidia bacterium]